MDTLDIMECVDQLIDKYGFEGIAYELPDPTSRWLVEYGRNAKLIK